MFPHEYMHLCMLAQEEEEGIGCSPLSFFTSFIDAESLPEPGAPVLTA